MIFDLAGNPITSYTLSLESEEVMTAQFLIECRTDYELSGSVFAGITVESKHNASGTWVDIETTPIVLTPWAGTRQIFDLRITGEETTVLVRGIENIRVGR